MAGRVPTTCGYCFETSPVPSASFDSAGHKLSKPVPNPSSTPVSLSLSAPQPLHPTLLNRYPVLDCLRLGPRRHPVEQHLCERPYVLRQARCHRGGTRPPHLRRPAAVGCLRPRQRLAQTGMGQHEIMIDVKQRQLIPQARFALTKRVDPASDRRYPLADVEVESLHKGGTHAPATDRQDLLDGQPGAEDHAVLDANDKSAPIRLHDLGIE